MTEIDTECLDDDVERLPLDIEEESTPYFQTEGVIVRPDGAVTFIRITPDIETVAAVMGGWCLGYSAHGNPFVAHAAMGTGLISPFTDPMGVGEPNTLARRAFHRLSGQEREMRGDVLIVNQLGDPKDASRMDAAVIEGATSLRDLRSGTPFDMGDDA